MSLALLRTGNWDWVRLPERAVFGVAAVTAGVGLCITLAPALPQAVVHPLLVGVTAFWGIVGIGGAVLAARFTFKGSAAGFQRRGVILGIVGILLVILGSTELEIIRVVANRPALVWNVDWRFALNHAQAIARTGGDMAALDYSGAPLGYHVGPAWLAGAVQRVFGAGMAGVLFGLVPVLSSLGTASGLLLILNAVGVSLPLAVLCSGMAMTMPAIRESPLSIYWSLSDVFTHGEQWLPSAALMLNSHLGLAVGCGSLGLLLHPRSRRWQLALGVAGLASVIRIKPQYFVGLGMLAGVVAVLRLVAGGDRHAAVAARQTATAVALLPAIGVLVLLPRFFIRGFGHWIPGPNSKALFGGVLLLGLVAVGHRVGFGRFGRRSPVLFWLAGASLALACVFLIIMSGEAGSALGSASWAPGQTGWIAREYLEIYTLLFLVAVAALAWTRGLELPFAADGCYGLMWATLLAVTGLAAILHMVSFPLRPEALSRGMEVGGFGISVNQEQGNLAQSLQPLVLIMIAGSLALLAVTLQRLSSRWTAALTGAAALVVLSPLVFVIPSFQQAHGFEAAEDIGLFRVLKDIPRDGSLLISSDLADQAQDYRRPANAMLLTAYTGHAFYVSQLRYGRWHKRDASERLTALRAFFGSPWSAWHDQWLRSNRITHVLVSDRCAPLWLNDATLPLRPVSHHGHWIAYELPTLVERGAPGSPPSWSEMTPGFGLSECLLMRQYVAHGR